MVTTTVFNTNISNVKNKIPVLSDLVKKTDYHPKILEIGGKYITASDYKKLTSDILYANLKQTELVNKSDISNLVKNSYLSTTFAALAIKAEQNEIVKPHDLSYFLRFVFFFFVIMVLKMFISQHDT